MFAKGPAPGATPKTDALALLPQDTRCKRISAGWSSAITGYVVTLPDGRDIASRGTASQAWNEARRWALRHPEDPAVRAQQAHLASR